MDREPLSEDQLDSGENPITPKWKSIILHVEESSMAEWKGSPDLGVLPCLPMIFWRRTGLRLVASLLAAVVCADVTLDAACDPIAFPGPPATAAVTPDETGGADTCADFCVPDCFCCSRSETAGPALVLPALTALAQVLCASPESVPAVVRPVPQPPPLALS
jgi:hypothetical protein